MNTRQFPNTPRTMSEAFGPYAGQDLQPMAEPRGELRTAFARTRAGTIALAVAYAMAFVALLVVI